MSMENKKPSELDKKLEELNSLLKEKLRLENLKPIDPNFDELESENKEQERNARKLSIEFSSFSSTVKEEINLVEEKIKKIKEELKSLQ